MVQEKARNKFVVKADTLDDWIKRHGNLSGVFSALKDLEIRVAVRQIPGAYLGMVLHELVDGVVLKYENRQTASTQYYLQPFNSPIHFYFAVPLPESV